MVIDRDADGSAWEETRQAVAAAERVYSAFGRSEGIECWFEADGGHRPYPAHPAALQWLQRHVRPAGLVDQQVDEFATVNFGVWAEKHGIPFEPLYGTPLHLRGATVVDMGIQPLDSLAVLKSDEIGSPLFTIEGWLDHVAPTKPANPSEER